MAIWMPINTDQQNRVVGTNVVYSSCVQGGHGVGRDEGLLFREFLYS
jgi:hypothetical protein